MPGIIRGKDYGQKGRTVLEEVVAYWEIISSS
jgi:hypothetical protein